MTIACMILAGGKGKRFQSDRLKLTHDLAGLSVIEHVMTQLDSLEFNQKIIITSPHFPPDFPLHNYTNVVQPHPLGTGDAARVGSIALLDTITEVVILCADSPLLQRDTVADLLAATADFSLIQAKIPTDHQHKPYGRLNHDDTGNPTAIIEYNDATPLERAYPYVNGGVYKMKRPVLKEFLKDMQNNNVSGEYYLTDILAWCVQNHGTTQAITADFNEILGINTRLDLEIADEVIQKRLKNQMRDQGVTFLNAATTRLSMDTIIGRDTVIEGGVTLKSGVVIGNNCHIKSFSYLENCHIADHVVVGPFAHVHSHSHLHPQTIVGNFVELKNTHLGTGTKVKHLSYLGDARIGNSCNIGAGTMTANYDGYHKHRTTIDNGAHIGVQTVLIAPLHIGENAMTGAGSVITETIPAEGLALSRVPQITKEKGATRYKKRKILQNI